MFSTGKNPVIKKKERRRDDDREEEERANSRKRRREEDSESLREYKIRAILDETESYQMRVKEESELAQNSAKQDNVPLSLEEMMKKRAEEEAQKKKPVFLTKEERQKRALEERRRQVEEAREKAQKERELLTRNEPTKEVKRLSQIEEQMEKEKCLEMDKIKEQYVGKKREKRRILKPSEKFKLMFEWDEEEDTLRGSLPFFTEDVVEFRPQFGRGFLGGMDRGVQIKNFKHKDIDVVKVEVKEKEDQIQLDLIDDDEKQRKHWSQKKKEEMDERDWRIFKEDFNITTKGTNIPHPIRYWEESSLPSEIKLALKEAEYKDPTPIQRQAIPIALSGRDVVGVAETGSGFTIICIQRIFIFYFYFFIYYFKNI
jgi:ATP-dependent RNA helicase DDX23/PRP28